MMKGERMAKRSSAFGSIVKSRLSDITNPQSQHTLVGLDEKQPPIPNSTEDLINQLLKVQGFLWVWEINYLGFYQTSSGLYSKFHLCNVNFLFLWCGFALDYHFLLTGKSDANSVCCGERVSLDSYFLFFLCSKIVHEV